MPVRYDVDICCRQHDNRCYFVSRFCSRFNRRRLCVSLRQVGSSFKTCSLFLKDVAYGPGKRK